MGVCAVEDDAGLTRPGPDQLCISLGNRAYRVSASWHHVHRLVDMSGLGMCDKPQSDRRFRVRHGLHPVTLEHRMLGEVSRPDPETYERDLRPLHP